MSGRAAGTGSAVTWDRASVPLGRGPWAFPAGAEVLHPYRDDDSDMRGRPAAHA